MNPSKKSMRLVESRLLAPVQKQQGCGRGPGLRSLKSKAGCRDMEGFRV